MPYERPGKAVPVVASAAVRHGAPAADDGHCGRAIKTKTPGADVPRADRDLIAVAEGYNLRVRGVMEVPTGDIAGVAKGQLVYITEATNALSLAAGAGKIVLGKVTHLAGQQGTPTGLCRVDLEQKV